MFLQVSQYRKIKCYQGFFFFKKTATWELTPYVVPEIPKLLKYAADMFKLFSFEEICWFYVLHLPKDIMLRILTFLGEYASLYPASDLRDYSKNFKGWDITWLE